ncbi:MAG: YitT family protein, partial [Solobacterium sp.]|nr:YitT family protein [Solobacterium sp.]
MIGGIVNAFGVTMFLLPVNLYDSGISGTSMLLSQLTPPFLSLPFFLIILNIPLFLYGLKKQGKEFTVLAVYAVLVYAIVSWIIIFVLPIDVSFLSPFAKEDLLLCSLFGGILSGIGSGLVIRGGAAIDGIEVLAVTFAKRLGLTVGSFMMIYNLVLYVLSGLIFQSWILPLYSVIAYMAASKTVDYVVEGFDRAKGAMIITTKQDEISKTLSDTFESGVTKIDAKGGYSNGKKGVVYFVVNRFQ